MTTPAPRSIPLLGDIALDAVQHIEHALDGGFAPTRIAGLDGELHQRAGRPSHHIRLRGELIGDGATDALSTLQAAAAAGEELTFAADITTALDLRKVVVLRFTATEVAGSAGRYHYELHLAESPPLPPPAELEGFGGLDDFGLGDLGFDDLGGLLDDISDLAGQVAGAVDAALDAVAAIQSLAALADLGVPDPSGLLAPLTAPVERIGAAGQDFLASARALGAAFGGPG